MTPRRLIAALLLVTVAAPAIAAERYGWLGVRIRDLSEAEAEDLAVKLGVREGYGVVVAEILKDTPAEASGLRAGDLIVSIDGRPLVETRTLQRLVGATPAGQELRLVVLREGQRRELRIRVGAMPPDVVAERVAAEFGFIVRDASAEEAPSGAVRPAVVAGVLERSAADHAGLRVGDRVVGVNGEAVGSVDAFRRRLQGVVLRESLRLRVERRGEPLDLVLPPAQPSLPSQ